MTNTTTTRPFLNRNTGISINANGGRKPYALMMGAFLTKDAEYVIGEGDKKNQIRCNIAINSNPFALLGEDVAAEHAGDPYTSEESPFMQLIAFGELADQYKGLKKGAKIFFAGPLSLRAFTRRDGNEGFAVQVIANELIAADCRAGKGDNPKDSIYCMTNFWKDKSGKENMQKLCLLTGTVKSSKELTATANGNVVRNFNVELGLSATRAEALCNGTYNKDATYFEGRYVNLGRWGEAAKHLDKVLVPGNVVAVLATLVAREGDDGSKFINGTALDIAVLKWAQDSSGSAPAATSTPASAPTPAPMPAPETYNAPEGDGWYAVLDEDDEDGLPF